MPEELDKDGMPVFVRIEEYKEVLDIMNMVKNKIDQAKEILGRINELKNEEDAELELWRSGIEEVERKIMFVDKTLFEPESL